MIQTVPWKLRLGLLLLGASFVLCWPVIAVLTFVGIRTGYAWLGPVATPFIWGITHGMNVAGLGLIGVDGAQKGLEVWRGMRRK